MSTILELVHQDQIVRFNTLGGDDSGALCLSIGGRSITDAPTAGRYYDTITVEGGLGVDTAAVRRAVRLIDTMAEQATVNTPSTVILREQVEGETRAKEARVWGITHTYVDGIPDWSLYKKHLQMVITIERDANWGAPWVLRQDVSSISYGASAFERTASLADLDVTSGDRPGQVEFLRLSAANGNAPQLQEAFIGFKQRRGAQALKQFSPRVDIGSSVNDVGIPNASLTSAVTNAAYWGGNALQIRFADPTLNVYERSFRARARCLFQNWNNVGGQAYYEQYVGRYRVIGLVRYSDVDATYQMRAGVYGGAFYSTEPVAWLDDIYRIIKAGDSSSAFVDFGELVLPPPPSGSNAYQFQASPTIVFGAGLISGTSDAQVTVEQLWIVPADGYAHVKHRTGVPYPQAIDIRGDRDGGAVAFTSSAAAAGPDAPRIMGDRITEMQVGEEGLFCPHRPGSVMVVVANRTVKAELGNRPMVRTYRD